MEQYALGRGNGFTNLLDIRKYYFSLSDDSMDVYIWLCQSWTCSNSNLLEFLFKNKTLFDSFLKYDKREQ